MGEPIVTADFLFVNYMKDAINKDQVWVVARHCELLWGANEMTGHDQEEVR